MSAQQADVQRQTRGGPGAAVRGSSVLGSLALLAACTLLSGCPRMHRTPPDKYVYVTAKQAYLRDRVAAVSNRSGEVANGERLTVLEHARHFVKVRSPRGEVGWLEERAVATQEVDDQFEALAETHSKDPVVGQATTRDEVYLHATPGRDTDRFFRLAEGEKLAILGRAMVAKPVTAASALAAAAPKPAVAAKPAAAKLGKAAKLNAADTTGAAADAPAVPPPPAMEDWWLVRTPEGHTGWIYSHLIDVDAPEALERYAEGQRIVGAYVLAHVNDPDSGQLKDGQPDPDIPEYLTVLSPYKGGLPYDFNQVRIFTWNLKKHRYETAFREHNVAGFLPVRVFMSKDPYGKTPLAQQPLPTFQYKVLPDGAPPPAPDPATGELKPKNLITKTYRLEGSIVARVLPPNTPPPAEAHPDPEPEKKKRR